MYGPLYPLHVHQNMCDLTLTLGCVLSAASHLYTFFLLGGKSILISVALRLTVFYETNSA